MAAAIPTMEPDSITAGDTVKWTRSFADYSAADGWTLSYALQKEGQDGQPITFSSTASGSDHLISLSPATTQAWPSGQYLAQAYVSKSGDRYLVWQGAFAILENFAGGQSIDPRSQAKRILDFINASWEKVAKKQVVYATIDGVQLQFRSIKELREASDYWSIKVRQEDAARLGRQRPSIVARFTRPS
jgi:hypothetical protein